MIKKQKIKIIRGIILSGCIVSILFHYLLSNYFGYRYYPYNTFLFNPADRFNDFYNIYNVSSGFNPYTSPVSVYFPFTFVLMHLFTFVTNAHLALYLFLFLFLTFTFFYVHRTVSSLNNGGITATVIIVLMSYPVLFNLDRGNSEALLFIFTAMFIYYYQKNKDLRSVFFLSLAISMKLYPIVFVVLFLADKKYKNTFYTISAAAFITLSSALILDGGIIYSFTQLKQNIVLFKNTYIMTDHGLQHNSSLYGVIKLLIKLCPQLLPILKYYSVLAMTSLLFIAFYIMRENILWKKVCLLVFFMILFPQVSYDYKLIHVLIPLTLFINDDRGDYPDTFYAILLSLLMTPKDYYLITKDISIAVLINPLIMLMITGKIIYDNYYVRRYQIFPPGIEVSSS